MGCMLKRDYQEYTQNKHNPIAKGLTRALPASGQ